MTKAKNIIFVCPKCQKGFEMDKESLRECLDFFDREEEGGE